MKKVIVIGCPGSGKSTLSKSLAVITGIPLYHLDMMYWNADKTTVGKAVFLERLTLALKEEEWIIDGNYSSTMEMRMAACDTVIFLDYPTDVCLDGIRARRGKARSDIPWVENEDDAEFIEFIKTFKEKERPKVISLIGKLPDKSVIILKSREESDIFLKNIEKIRCKSLHS